MFKKLSAIVLICTILTTGFSPNIFASDSYYEYAKEALMETPNGEKYIMSLDILIPKLSDAKLTDIKSRLDNAFKNSVSLSENNLALLEYIDVIVREEITKRAMTENISTEDREAVEKEMLVMQTHLWNSVNSLMDDMIINWNSLSRYKETGDLSMMVKAMMPNVLEMEAEANINNYTNENQSLDSRFTGDVSGYVTVSEGERTESIKAKSMLDLISKDGLLYILLENLEVESSDLGDYMERSIEKLQELAETNTYLESENVELEELLGLIGGMTSLDIESKIDELKNNPMLEAYRKDGDMYILRPTKEFCDLGKELEDIFDPFGSNTLCSGSQYETMLDGFYRSGAQFSLSLDGEKKLTYTQTSNGADMDISMKWNRSKMTSMNMNIVTNIPEDNEYFTMDWLMGESLNIAMQVEGIAGNIEMDFGRTSSIESMTANFEYINPFNDDIFTLNTSYTDSMLESTLIVKERDTNVTCTMWGLLTLDKAKLALDCSMQDISIAYLGTGSDTIQVNANLDYNGKYSKNDLHFDMSVVSGSAYLDMLIKNMGERVSMPEREILTPVKSISEEEVQSEIFDEIYGTIEY